LLERRRHVVREPIETASVRRRQRQPNAREHQNVVARAADHVLGLPGQSPFDAPACVDGEYPAPADELLPRLRGDGLALALLAEEQAEVWAVGAELRRRR